MSIEGNGRFYGSGGDALRTITAALDHAQTIRIATAYFEASGYQCLEDVLANKEFLLLIGREQGGRDRLNDVINEFINSLSMGDWVHRTRAMRQMLSSLEQGKLIVGVSDDPLDKTSWMDGRYLYQHAKLYIGDQDVAVVTSANMSRHGLIQSREAGIPVTDPDDVRFFVERFDRYFGNARSITDEFIDKLKAWLNAYDPFVIYARALLELYGLPEDEVPIQLPQLADYQRPAVTRVKNNIEEHDGTLFVASTGLGKTVMAAHVVAYLRMQGLIDDVLIFCPAGLRDVWHRFMRSAKTSSEEFSYHILSMADIKHKQNLIRLERELESATAKTLIIADESHRLRNDDKGDRLRNRRIIDAVREGGAKLLMMTATPFSKGIDDVNNQLSLLPKPRSPQVTELSLAVEETNWRVSNGRELSELPPCFVLTMPSVVKFFGQIDEETGERYVSFSANDRRYFPRQLHIRTISYDNPLDDFLLELLDSELLHTLSRTSGVNEHQMSLFDTTKLEFSGTRDPLFECKIVNQFCSSPAQIKKFCKSAIEGFPNTRFARQDALAEFIQKNESKIGQVSVPKYDPKIQRLFQIIEAAGDKKVVVFCIYRATARYLEKHIRQEFPEIQTETTEGHDLDGIDAILQRFAPIANEVPEELRTEPIQILIATEALAEGYNLQDAEILVNYDLPWTVLRLAQRMGRILRPWHEPRTITIYNFISSTMKQAHYMAVNWGKRLSHYGEQHRAFAEIPVILGTGDKEEAWEMMELANEMQHFDEVDLDFDEVMKFIQHADQLQTTSFYDDLAMISLDDATFYRTLPPAIRTARSVRGRKQLFVLFQYQSRHYPALFDEQGNMQLGSEDPDAIMKIIRCSRSEPKTAVEAYPDDDEFDQWIEIAKVNWAEHLAVTEIHRVTIVCVMALMPRPA